MVTCDKENGHEDFDGAYITRSIEEHGPQDGILARGFGVPYFVFRDAGVDLTLGDAERLPAPDRPQKRLAGSCRTFGRKISTRYSTWVEHGPMWDLVDKPDRSG